MGNAGNSIRVAYGSVPKDSGTYTFYRNLRPQLADHGIDLRCVTVGQQQAQLCEEDYTDDGCVLVAANVAPTRRQAELFSQWCDAEDIDIVIGLNSKPILSALPHLRQSIRVVARCANAFDHGYRITLAGRERLAAIVATTPRLQRDLIRDYGADPGLMHLIPNGIDTSRFDAASARARGDNESLRIGFLGRLEHGQKGVLHIPPVVRELQRRNLSFTLAIAGKGRERGALEQALRREVESGVVQFSGAISAQQVPEFLGNSDVLLFPSHFEGCPNVLLEALAAGAVPTCWEIEGITDFILQPGNSGFLAAVGDTAAMAGHIERLARDRELLRTCSARGARDCRARFDAATAAAAYAKLFRAVMETPAPPCQPRPWSKFQINPNFPEALPARALAALRRQWQGLIGPGQGR